MVDALTLLAGVLCAAMGGELFLRGVLGISAWLRIPKAVTAATLAAFATSSPEISVAVNAALTNTPQLALGDAVGSNIVNVGLVLGIVLCMGRVPFHWRANRREFGWALVVPLIILVVLADGFFSRWEAIVCLLLFIFWLFLTLRQALHGRRAIEVTHSRRQGLVSFGLGIAGLALLVLAGRLIVQGASAIGAACGMDEFLIGATIVALGTSSPELATAVIAKFRGYDEIGVGTVLGSNIFNCLFIVGLTAVITPYHEPLAHVLPSLLFSSLVVVALVPLRGDNLPRGRGILLLSLYAGSVVTVVIATR